MRRNDIQILFVGEDFILASKEALNLKCSEGYTSYQTENNIWVTLAREVYEASFIFALKHLTRSRGAEASVQQGREVWFFS